MKYLKYILGIIIILAIAFFSLGIIKPKISYDAEILVDKPKAETWAVIQDEDKLSEWLPGFQKIEHVSGTPGTVGAVSNVYFINNGQNMSIKETITDFLPNESISMSFVSDFMNMDYKLALTSDNGKTKIKTNTITMGNGMISKSIMALMGRTIKEQEETNLSNLKKAIEQNTKNYSLAEEIIIESNVDKK